MAFSLSLPVVCLSILVASPQALAQTTEEVMNRFNWKVEAERLLQQGFGQHQISQFQAALQCSQGLEEAPLIC